MPVATKQPPGAHAAKSVDPIAIGRRVGKGTANYILSNKNFWKTAQSVYFQTTVRGTVVALRRAAGQNQVQIQRTGQSKDPNWYTIWANMYNPKQGDNVILSRMDDKTWYVSQVQNGGAVNELRVFLQNGQLVYKDSAGRVIHQQSDDHTATHMRKDGSRPAVVHTEKGDIVHIGQHRQTDGKGVVASSSAPAPAVRSTVVKYNDTTRQHETYINYNDSRGDVQNTARSRSTHKEYAESGRGNGHAAPFTVNYKGITSPIGHTTYDDGAETQLYDPSTAPQAVGVSSPNPTSLQDGSVIVCYSYLTGWDTESLPSPQLAVAITAGQQVAISVPALPAGYDAVRYYASDGPDSTNLLHLGDGSASFTMSAYATDSSITPQATNNTAIPNPTTGPVLTATTGGTWPNGSIGVAYAWNTPWGQSALSPVTTITLTGTQTAIHIASIPAPPSGYGITSFTLYISPSGTNSLMRLVALSQVNLSSNPTFPYAVTVNSPAPPGATVPPTGNTTTLTDPTVAATLTPQTPTVTTSLPAGTYRVCYALNAGSAHTVASPTRPVGIGAGQAVQLGPVEFPGNASGVTWYMSAVVTGTPTTIMYQVATASTGDAITVNNAPPTTNAQPPTTNTTSPSVTGNVVDQHANGNKVRSSDGKDTTHHANNTKHTVMHKEYHTTHFDGTPGSGSEKPVHHVSVEGHSKHLGHKVHNATSLTLGANNEYVEKGGHKHDHLNGQYEHGHDPTASGTYTRLRAHHPTDGEKVYAADGATVEHVRVHGGHTKHAGDVIHGAILDSAGNHSGSFTRSTVAGGVRARTLNVNGAERSLYDHDGRKKTVYAYLDNLVGAFPWLFDYNSHHHPKGHQIDDDAPPIASPVVACTGHVSGSGGAINCGANTSFGVVYTFTSPNAGAVGGVAETQAGPAQTFTFGSAVTAGAIVIDALSGGMAANATGVKYYMSQAGAPGGPYYYTGVTSTGGSAVILAVPSVAQPGSPGSNTTTTASRHRRKHASGARIDDHDGQAWRSYSADTVHHKHHPNKHTVQYDAAGNVTHHHSVLGHHAQLGDKYYAYSGILEAADGSGAVIAPYHRKHVASHVYTHIQNLNDGKGERTIHQRHASQGHIDWQDDGSNSGTMVAIVKRTIGLTGNGGISQYKPHGTTSAFHVVGDNGSGGIRVTHQNGAHAVTHTGSAVTMQSSAGISALYNDGNSFYGYASGYQAFRHDGSTHHHYVLGQERVQFAQNSAGGVMNALRSGASDWHQFGDDGSGHPHIQSQQNRIYMRSNAGAQAHYFDASTTDGWLTFPAGSYLNTHADRINSHDSSGNGAIKADSHSMYLVYDSFRESIGTSPGLIVQYNGNGLYDNPHFKHITKIMWYQDPGGQVPTGGITGASSPPTGCPPYFAHAHTTASGNSGSGAFPWYNGSANGSWGYAPTQAFADYSIWLYGKTNAGSAFSGNITIKQQGVNV